MRVLALLAFLAAAAVGAGHAAAAEEVDELVVRFAPGTGAAAREGALASAGARPVRPMALDRALVAEVDRPDDVPGALAGLRGRDDVQWAEANRRARLRATPGDPHLPRQWSLGAIRAPAAWELVSSAPDVLVAVIDSGVGHHHPDLTPNVVRDGRARDLWDRDDDPWDPSDAAAGAAHGTHVASTIGARGGDGAGMAGLAWDVGILPLRACGPGGHCAIDAVADAIVHAGRVGARVANLSLSSPGRSRALRDALRSSPATLFVAAAGNEGRDLDGAPATPCAEPVANVVCVAATDASHRLAGFSNHGRRSVHLGAPGVDVLGARSPGVPAAAGLMEDFEGGLGAFELAAGGTWTLAPGAGRGGSRGVRDSPGHGYPPNADNRLRTSPLDLRGGDGCRVSAWVRGDSERDRDVLRIETSDGSTWDAHHERVSGPRPSYRRVEHFARGASGRAAARLRLRMTSDASVSREGFVVDDVRIRCVAPAPASHDDLRRLNGTSMATAHVSGVAALVTALRPDLGPRSVRRALLAGARRVPRLAGRVASGAVLDARGALDAAAGMPAESVGLDVCAPPGPPRGRSGTSPVRLSAAQLRINQRIGQAAIRRLNGVEAWLDAGVGERDICGATIGPDRLADGVVTAVGGEVAPARPAAPRPVTPAPPRRGSGGEIRLGRRQLLINQRIHQAALRRARALSARLDGGLTGGDLRPGSVGADRLHAGLRVTAAARTGGDPPPSVTEVAPRRGGDPGAVRLSAAQLRINQRIAQAAVREANDLVDRVESGITGRNLAPGTVTASRLGGDVLPRR